MRVPNSNIDCSSVQQKVVLVTIGLVSGFVLSMFSYFVITGLERPYQDTASTVSLDSATDGVNTADALLERLASDEISSTDLNTANLQKISENLQTFNTEELVKALGSSASFPYSRNLHPIQEILCEHLVERSPSEALRSVWLFQEHRKVALLRIVVRGWALQDIEESFTVAIGLQQPYKEIAIETILSELDVTDEVFSVLQSSDYDEIEKYRAEQTHELEIYKTISRDPSAAFDLLLKDNVEDSEQAHLFSQAFNEMFQLEGFDAITKLNFLSFDREFFDELLLQIFEQDRLGMIGYLQNLSPTKQSRFMYPLMDNWVEADVESVLPAVESLSNPTYRASTYRTLVSSWGRIRPLELLNRLAEIPREHRDSAVFYAFNTLGETNPNAVLSLLSSLKAIPGAFNQENERTFVYSWSSKFPYEALKWVQENVETETTQRNWMLSRVLGEYALVQPKEAMEVAITEDPNPERGELGLAYNVIDSLASDDQLDTAIDLLDQVPKHNQAYIYAEVAEKLVLKDRLNEVMSLSNRLPAADRVDYFHSVATKLSYNHSSAVLTLVAKIPDTLLRSDVVNQILNDTWMIEEYYTEGQRESLRSLVTE